MSIPRFQSISPRAGVLFALAMSLLLAWPSVGEAKRRKKRKGKAPAAAKVNMEAVGELMGPFKFGMNKDEVLKVLNSQLKDRYQVKIKDTEDVYRQDALRRERLAESKRIADSYTEFRGKKTGWDVSIVDEQFAHKTDESMLVYWENNPDGSEQRRFFFFHNGQLYKMFIALNASTLPKEQQTFPFFKTVMERRYGPSNVVVQKRKDKEDRISHLDWRTPKYHLQAIDKLSFYGSLCLTIADPDTEAIVEAAREANKTPKKKNAVIEAMVEGDDGQAPSLDSNDRAIDSALK